MPCKQDAGIKRKRYRADIFLIKKVPSLEKKGTRYLLHQYISYQIFLTTLHLMT